MATQLQIRRGTTAQMNAFTGAEGELAVNTSTDTVHVHDGATAGGFALAKADGSNIGTYAGSFTTLAASGAVTLSSTLAVTGALTVDTDTLVVDATNNRVGIGVSPVTTLDVKGSSDLVASFRSSTNNGNTSESKIRAVDSDSSHVATFLFQGYEHRFQNASGTEQMRIDSSGNLSLNSNGSIAALDGVVGMQIGNTSVTNAGLALETNNRGYLMYINGTALSFWDSSANSDRMRIDASGNLLVGTSAKETQGVTIYGNGANGIYSATTSTSAYWVTNLGLTSATGTLFSFYNNATVCGNITITSTNVTNYTSVSDQRLKENIADADDAGSKIDAIQVRKFDWKSGGEHQDYGFIAQELLEIAPVAVSVPEDSEEMMSVDPAKLVPMMLKEIQSLRTRVQELENN